MKIAFFYDPFSTFIGTVKDHASALLTQSDCKIDYFPVRDYTNGNAVAPQDYYDWIVVHYSVRLPGNTFKKFLNSLKCTKIQKALFIQDEYDKTNKTKKLIKEIKFQIVFTCVPKKNITHVYSKKEFKKTQFISVLTGYIPNWAYGIKSWKKHNKRPIDVGYRGRRLPFRYGILGQMKFWIGDRFPKNTNGIKTNISSEENDRLYGNDWISFLGDCRCVLGAESGCNIFDWNGELEKKEAQFRSQHPNASYSMFKKEVLRRSESPNLMNQISPRIFEAIAQKTTLLLYRGAYSGILKPYKHYFPIEHDYSNIKELVNFIKSSKRVEAMANFAFNDILKKQKYTYTSFGKLIFLNLRKRMAKKPCKNKKIKNKIKSTSVLSKLSEPLSIDEISKDVLGLSFKYIKQEQAEILGQKFYPVANSRKLIRSLIYLFIAKIYIEIKKIFKNSSPTKFMEFILEKYPREKEFIYERIKMIKRKQISPL